MNETKHIQTLIQRAAEAASAMEAMQYSQAANNAANAAATLLNIQTERERK